MKREHARILVIGAGVNGSVCATRLHHAGFDVTVLARGKRYEEIRDAGIVIEDPMTKQRSVTRVPVINALDPQDSYEYILVIVRKTRSRPFCRSWPATGLAPSSSWGTISQVPMNIPQSWARIGSC